MPEPRYRQVSVEDTPYYHCISRCVRRAFLCGSDPVTGFNFEHRRQWIVDRIRLLCSVFAVDLCAYAIMSNHYHIVIRINADEVGQWTDEEVARRWMQIFSGPLLMHQYLCNASLTESELNYVADLFTTWRERLCDLSWFMRCLNEPIARMANAEDHCSGRFWEGRFKSQALLDQRALLTCMAYVDLNPIRAAIAQSPATSDFTSIQQRIKHPDRQRLMPFSDAGRANQAIPYRYNDYRQLVDWAGRTISGARNGVLPETMPASLERLGIAQEPLIKYLANRQQEPVNALGPASRLKAMAASLGMKFLRGVSLGKQLYPEPG